MLLTFDADCSSFIFGEHINDICSYLYIVLVDFYPVLAKLCLIGFVDCQIKKSVVNYVALVFQWIYAVSKINKTVTQNEATLILLTHN